jgi:hypothetical protein
LVVVGAVENAPNPLGVLVFELPKALVNGAVDNPPKAVVDGPAAGAPKADVELDDAGAPKVLPKAPPAAKALPPAVAPAPFTPKDDCPKPDPVAVVCEDCGCPKALDDPKADVEPNEL